MLGHLLDGYGHLVYRGRALDDLRGLDCAALRQAFSVDWTSLAEALTCWVVSCTRAQRHGAVESCN